MASVCRWEGRAKLANLVTRLQGQAYSFYRTCPVHQRTSYEALTAALTEQFKPVRIKSVQSGLFHERKQKSKESVEEYAQDLNRLYQRAYPHSERGSADAERMGQTVLAYQFVAGLKPEIRLKVAGHEGSFEQLLTKARLEEAKLRDLQPTSENAKRMTERIPQGRPQLQGPSADIKDRRCFVCGQGGHLKRQCPQLQRGRLVEAPGATGRNTNNRTITNHLELSQAQLKVEQLRKELQSAELQQALVTKSMHVLKPKGEAQGPVLGPAISVEILLEGQIVNALVDTGSPITIVFTDCLLDVLAKLRTPNQTLEEWKQEVKDRFQTATLSVNNYGGGEVNVAGQLPVSLKLGDKECRAIILVQKGATVDLLLGTDLLTQLGFCVLKTSNKVGQMMDLLQGDVWKEKGLTTTMKYENTQCRSCDESSTGEVGASEQLAGKEDI